MGTNSKDNDAIDRLFDSSNFAANARASDGRGPAFWAWEYQNAYVLGSLMVSGGDAASMDEDLQGQTAISMCVDNSECNKDDLLAEAKGMMEDIKTRKEERAKKAEEDDDDSDFDVDDAPSGGGAD